MKNTHRTFFWWLSCCRYHNNLWQHMLVLQYWSVTSNHFLNNSTNSTAKKQHRTERGWQKTSMRLEWINYCINFVYYDITKQKFFTFHCMCFTWSAMYFWMKSKHGDFPKVCWDRTVCLRLPLERGAVIMVAAMVKIWNLVVDWNLTILYSDAKKI